jgi:hypothetical protein
MTYTPPKYKLIRFTDVTVQRGHKYRYRVRVQLNDPNHPDGINMLPPSLASLHGDVQKRIKALDAEDAKRPKDQTGLPYRRYWVWSPWSDPSPVAELPPPERILASKVTPTRYQKIRNADVPILEPTVDAFAVQFDPAKIADVPAQHDKVSRGSVLNFVQDTKVIHPVLKTPVELQKYSINTNAMVADIMGGETMRPVATGTASNPALTALGEILVVDSHGNLHVQNEAQDIENIRRFTVPKEDPNKAKEVAGDEAGLTGEYAAPGGRRPRRGSAGCF